MNFTLSHLIEVQMSTEGEVVNPGEVVEKLIVAYVEVVDLRTRST